MSMVQSLISDLRVPLLAEVTGFSGKNFHETKNALRLMHRALLEVIVNLFQNDHPLRRLKVTSG